MVCYRPVKCTHDKEALAMARRQSVADVLSPLLHDLVGGRLPVQIRCWDGSVLGSEVADAVVVLRSPNALRRFLYAPNELGLARAYVAGDIDVEGDIFAALAVRDAIAPRDRHIDLTLGLQALRRLVSAARDLDVLRRPLPPPPEEARLRGRRHTRARDAAAIAHHYDISNDFYRVVLGETMTYSCAYFSRPDMSLDDAQRTKYDVICRKLGLRPAMRLLDVGCGWGGMTIHAAKRYGVSAVGITLSEKQADLARKRVAEAGVADRVEIRIQDYRDVVGGPFDAISSIGMFEHVGAEQLGRYFEVLFGVLAPRGRLLNHAISRPGAGGAISKRSFISRYVFPDGELLEVGRVVSAMQRHGYEVRDVESLREHYGLTLRAWVANLEANWDRAQELVGPSRARIWKLYMAGSALGFEAGRINVHQVLGVKRDAAGASGMPLSRAELVGAPAFSAHTPRIGGMMAEKATRRTSRTR
jgi:cyclopropane-fatty-acyl-phospholipid synthase